MGVNYHEKTGAVYNENFHSGEKTKGGIDLYRIGSMETIEQRTWFISQRDVKNYAQAGISEGVLTIKGGMQKWKKTKKPGVLIWLGHSVG